MKFDAVIAPNSLKNVTTTAQAIEALGFDGLWTSETAHNPFLPLTLAASSTRRVELGTSIAVAFPRSPMVTAQLAWARRSSRTSPNASVPPGTRQAPGCANTSYRCVLSGTPSRATRRSSTGANFTPSRS
jgi:hypothetical protein